MGIKCRGRSEGQQHLFKTAEVSLFSALHESDCIQPPEMAFTFTKDPAPRVCVCLRKLEHVLQSLKQVFYSLRNQ